MDFYFFASLNTTMEQIKKSPTGLPFGLLCNPSTVVSPTSTNKKIYRLTHSALKLSLIINATAIIQIYFWTAEPNFKSFAASKYTNIRQTMCNARVAPLIRAHVGVQSGLNSHTRRRLNISGLETVLRRAAVKLNSLLQLLTN